VNAKPWVLIVAGVATIALAVGASRTHPQGNVGRVVPYVVAAIVVWSAAAVVVSGGRRGAAVACGTGAALFMAVAIYRFFVRPIPFAECGRLVEELDNRACRDHGDIGLVVLTVIATAVLVVAGVVVVRRQPAR